MRTLLERVAGRADLAQAGIVIPTGAALVVDARGRCTSRGKRPCERRSLRADGTWQVAPIG